MSDLQFNKIAGAVLATGLTIVTLGVVSEEIFRSDVAEKPGYAIAVAEVAEEGAAAEAPPDWGTVLPAANVATGASVAKKCVSCHVFEKGGANGTGPALWGVLGRDAGAVPGFAYSPNMVAHPAWDYENMDAFLKAPQRYIEGTKMSFVGLKKQEDRIAVIAYMRSMSDTPQPIPAPNPAAAAAAAGAALAAAGAGPTPTQDNNSTSLEGTEGTAGVVAGASDRAAAGGAAISGGVAGQAPNTGVARAANQDRSNPGGTGTGPTGADSVRQSGQGSGQSTQP
jgi:cytochrome c